MGLALLEYVISSQVPAGLVVVAIFLAFGYAIWRVATVRLSLVDSTFVVRNIFGKRAIPLLDVEHFEVGHNAWGIDLWLKAPYQKMVVHAVQKSNWAYWRGTRTRADILVDELNGIVQALRRADEVSSGRQTRPAVWGQLAPPSQSGTNEGDQTPDSNSIP
jgi:hypothetical protein